MEGEQSRYREGEEGRRVDGRRTAFRGRCWGNFGIHHDDGHFRIRHEGEHSPDGTVIDGSLRTRDNHLEEVRCGALAGHDIRGSDCLGMTDANCMILSEADRSLESVDFRPYREVRGSKSGLWRNAERVSVACCKRERRALALIASLQSST